MTAVVHPTVPVLVFVDVDVGIAPVVQDLNSIPGVRTWASCQGTIGEGGAEPYEAHVVASWTDENSRLWLKVRALNRGWLLVPHEVQKNTVYVYPRKAPA